MWSSNSMWFNVHFLDYWLYWPLFLCLLSISTSYFLKGSFKSFFPNFIGFLSFYYKFVLALYVSGYKFLIRYMYCKHFLSAHLSFSFLTCLVVSRSFSFRQSNLPYFLEYYYYIEPFWKIFAYPSRQILSWFFL